MGTGKFNAGGNPATETGISSGLMGHLGWYADLTFTFTIAKFAIFRAAL